MPWPYYFISTRDCFTHHLVPVMETIEAGGRRYIRTKWYFRAGEVPSDYGQVLQSASARYQGAGSGAEQGGSQQAGDAGEVAGVLNRLVSDVERASGGVGADAPWGGTPAGEPSVRPSRQPPGLLPIGVTTYNEVRRSALGQASGGAGSTRLQPHHYTPLM